MWFHANPHKTWVNIISSSQSETLFWKAGGTSWCSNILWRTWHLLSCWNKEPVQNHVCGGWGLINVPSDAAVICRVWAENACRAPSDKSQGLEGRPTNDLRAKGSRATLWGLGPWWGVQAWFRVWTNLRGQGLGWQGKLCCCLQGVALHISFTFLTGAEIWQAWWLLQMCSSPFLIPSSSSRLLSVLFFASRLFVFFLHLLPLFYSLSSSLVYTFSVFFSYFDSLWGFFLERHN